MASVPLCRANATDTAAFGGRFGRHSRCGGHPQLGAASDARGEQSRGSVCFHEAKAPSKDDIGEVAKRVRDRVVKWLRRHRCLDERAAEERGNEATEPSALAACTQLALADGAFVARPFRQMSRVRSGAAAGTAGGGVPRRGSARVAAFSDAVRHASRRPPHASRDAWPREPTRVGIRSRVA
jgi:hypothetical protein